MTPPIELRQFSPMGVSYRTPLDVLGPGEQAEDLPILTGNCTQSGFLLTDDRTDYVTTTCRRSNVTDTSEDVLRTRLSVTMPLLTELTFEQFATYVIIGDTSEYRWSIGDHAVLRCVDPEPPVRLAVYTGSTFLGSTASTETWGLTIGSEGQAPAGIIIDGNVRSVPSAPVPTGFIAPESITLYPPGKVPPP